MCHELGALWEENISLISELLLILLNCGCSMWAYLVICWRRCHESGGAPIQSDAWSAVVEQELGGSRAAQLQTPSAPARPADELGWRRRELRLAGSPQPQQPVGEQRPWLGLNAETRGCGCSSRSCPGHPQQLVAWAFTRVPAPALNPLFSRRIWP